MNIFEYSSALKSYYIDLLSRPGRSNHSHDKYTTTFCLYITLTLLCLILILFLGFSINRLYYLGLIGFPFIIPIGYTLHRKRIAHKVIAQLRNIWGKEVERNRDYLNIAQSYRLCNSYERVIYTIDDNTWADLNMDHIYSKIDRTHTTFGEVVLYKILRSPEVSDTVLKNRNSSIHLFQNDRNVREAVQLELLRLGRDKLADITSLLWSNRPQPFRYRKLLSILALIALMALFTPLIWGLSSLIFIILPIFVINLITSNIVRKQLSYQLPVIRYLASAIRCAGRLGRTDCPELSQYFAKLANLARATSIIPKKAVLINPEKGLTGDILDLMATHISVYFLIETRTFFAVLEKVEKHIDELRSLYLLLGELDALQAIASFRLDLPFFTEPEFSTEHISLEMQEGRHPLLASPTPNSINITANQSAFITGSNMAGKSTFLRTVAVNAIFAQTIHTCYASAYRGCFFKVISSINNVDQLEEGKSFYLKEAEKLLSIIKAVEGDLPCLCLIDELLIGTNSAERISAAVEILDYLNRGQDIVIISSHDIELARILQDRYDNYYFSDYCDEEGMHFDYKIKRGICSTKNAINLLNVLGYPKIIVDRARERLNRYFNERGKEGTTGPQ